MGIYEKEYYLLSTSSLEDYPLAYEECRRLPACPIEPKIDCNTHPDCPAYTNKLVKIDDPLPIFVDFVTDITKKEVIYADCYMYYTLSRFTFVVSPKLYKILSGMNIEGIQLIPAILLEDNYVKYVDFFYVHIYNVLPVLSVKRSRYQERRGVKISNNLLQIKFNARRMKAIPLENRLIFRLPLDRSYFFFHVSVVEKIMSVNPVGFDFLKVSDISAPNTDKIFF